MPARRPSRDVVMSDQRQPVPKRQSIIDLVANLDIRPGMTGRAEIRGEE